MSEYKTTVFISDEMVCCYPALFIPRAYQEGAAGSAGQPKYQLTILVDRDDPTSIERINNCIKTAIYRKWSDDGIKTIKKIKLPLQDAEDTGKDEDPIFENKLYFTAKNDVQPGIVDSNVQPILDQKEVYAGCICKASMDFYATDKGGGRRVAVSLRNFQKIRDGIATGATPSNPTDDFTVES